MSNHLKEASFLQCNAMQCPPHYFNRVSALSPSFLSSYLRRLTLPFLVFSPGVFAQDIFSIPVPVTTTEYGQKLEEIKTTQNLTLSHADTSRDNIVMSQSLLVLRNFLSPESGQNLSSRQIRADDMSSNPADVEPFRGTTWEFTYTVTNTYTNTVTFNDSVFVAEDGSVLLPGTDEKDHNVAISYAPSLGKYLLIVKGIFEELYVFALNGCCDVQGQYYLTSLDPKLKSPYPLTGTRTKGIDAETPVTPPETTSDNDFESGKQAGIQQCQTEPASCGISIPDRFEEGKQAGLQQCQTDPTSCGIAISDRFEEGKQAGLQQCQVTPSSSENGQLGIIEHLQAFYDFFLANRGLNVNYPANLIVPYEYAPEWQRGEILGYTVYLKDNSGNPAAYFEISFTPTPPSSSY